MAGPWSSQDLFRTGHGTFRIRVMQDSESQWHAHPHSEEIFIVLAGFLEIKTEAGDVEVGAGEMASVPKGMRHRTRAKGRVEAIVFEGSDGPADEPRERLPGMDLDKEAHAMAENKTKATGASVEDYLAARGSEEQIADCRKLMALLRKVTRKPPKMWGPSIVGYGSYRYVYESGRTGEAPVAGFAIRGREIVVYILVEGKEQQALLSRLGKHRMGKVCLYIKRLSDLDFPVLEKLVANSVAEVKRRHG